MSERTFDTIRADFEAAVRDHVFIVIRDDGPYRHLRCCAQDTSWDSWDIVTWPGYLSITGDRGGRVFSRTDDMLIDFFKGKANVPYWLEKCVAWDGPNNVVSLAATIDLRDEVFAEHAEHGMTFPSEAWADVIACAQVANGTAHDSELLAALFDAGIDPCDATVYVPNPCAVWQLFAIEWTRAKYVARIDANR